MTLRAQTFSLQSLDMCLFAAAFGTYAFLLAILIK